MILVDKPREIPKVDLNEKSEDLSYLEDILPNDDVLHHDENNRGYFPLPSLGLNYLNNLNLNLNLNLRSTSLWKIYENSFTKPGFITRRHDLDEISPDSDDVDTRSAFTISNFRRQLERSTNLLRQQLQQTDYRDIGTNDSLDSDDNNTEDEQPEDCSSQNTESNKIEEFWSSFFSFKGFYESTGVASNQSVSPPPINAFYSRISLSKYDCIKIAIMSITVAPIRAVGMFFSIFMAWSFAHLGTFRLSFEESKEHPLSLWRRNVRWLISNFWMRLFFFFAGFQWVKIKGKQAAPKDAPILVVAPHSSFWDAFVLTILGSPSAVAKSESRNMPFFGKLIDFTQPVYVERESRTSRQDSAQAIIKRSQGIQSVDGWPQIFIFPEGTCSNRSCLISYKPGGFNPGVPVQPVIIRYPNRFDCITWTFDGPSPLRNAWFTLCQFNNYIEVEFLPVYYPTDEEKTNAKLYAQNVRNTMADCLGVPMTDFTYEEGMVLVQMRSSSLRKKLHVVKMARLGLKIAESRETTFITENTTRTNIDWNVTPQLFLQHMKVDIEGAATSQEIKDLFTVFNPNAGSIDAAEQIDLREYIFFAMFFQMGIEEDRLSSILFWMYCQDTSSMPKETFLSVMNRIFECKSKDAESLFASRAIEDAATIHLDEFKTKLHRRMEFIKLFSMEVSGELQGNHPSTESRAELRYRKPKVD